MQARTLFGLILVNLIWSAHPAMGKIVLESLSPVHAAWARYFSALLAWIIVVTVIKGLLPAVSPLRIRLGAPFLPPKTSKLFVLLLGLGFTPFCFSPIFQMTGLAATRSIDNALIIAIEPLMTVFLAWAFLRERPGRGHWVSFGLAMTGFALLSELTPGRVTGGFDSHLMGNLMMLIALIGEAFYSVIGRTLISRHSPVSVFGTALLLGVACLSIVTLIFSLGAGFPSLGSVSVRSFLAILWMGPLGTTACYLFWMIALVEAPVASLAITLFVQPVMGTVWGYAFMGERLTLLQAFGGVLILTAVFAHCVVPLKKSINIS